MELLIKVLGWITFIFISISMALLIIVLVWAAIDEQVFRIKMKRIQKKIEQETK